MIRGHLGTFWGAQEHVGTCADWGRPKTSQDARGRRARTSRDIRGHRGSCGTYEAGHLGAHQAMTPFESSWD
eukprot:8536529-Pyramimonas_sp.AAC.1